MKAQTIDFTPIPAVPVYHRPLVNVTPRPLVSRASLHPFIVSCSPEMTVWNYRAILNSIDDFDKPSQKPAFHWSDAVYDRAEDMLNTFLDERGIPEAIFRTPQREAQMVQSRREVWAFMRANKVSLPLLEFLTNSPHNTIHTGLRVFVPTWRFMNS